MTSLREIEAHSRNSLKSTGPKTEAGKQAAPCNAGPSWPHRRDGDRDLEQAED